MHPTAWLTPVFLRMRGVKGDDAKAQELQQTLEEKLKGYEIILSRQKYLAGDVSLSQQIFSVMLFLTKLQTGSDAC